MTLPALLLAAAVLAPTPQPATVPTGIRPPVSVGTTPTSCGVITLRINAPATVAIAFDGDLWDQPPTTAPASWNLTRTPGTTIRARVLYLDNGAEAAVIDVKVPPCLSAPPEPRRVVVDDTVQIGTPVTIVRRRADFWDWMLRRWGAR